MTNEEGRAVIRAARPVEANGAIVPAQGTALGQCPTNLPDTPLGRALVFNGTAPGTLEVEPGKPLRMIARYWLVIPDKTVDEETGELHEFARVVLYDRHGGTFRTSGQAAPQQIARLSQLYPPEMWEAGIPIIVTCTQSKRRKGSTWHDIRVDIETLLAKEQ